MSDPISVRARFERFPATVKGAFIFRGEDANPHQVVVGGARVSALGAGGSSPVPMAPVVPFRARDRPRRSAEAASLLEDQLLVLGDARREPGLADREVVVPHPDEPLVEAEGTDLVQAPEER